MRFIITVLLDLEYLIFKDSVKHDLEKCRLYLQARLRRYPYWRAGHLEIARIYLKLNQTLDAYSATQTALALKSDSESNLILATIYVRTANFEHASKILEDLWQKQQTIEIAEELAACYLAKNEQVKLQNFLSNIELNSPELASLRTYVKNFD